MLGRKLIQWLYQPDTVLIDSTSSLLCTARSRKSKMLCKLGLFSPWMVGTVCLAGRLSGRILRGLEQPALGKSAGAARSAQRT